jgi:hypothetical protein
VTGLTLPLELTPLVSNNWTAANKYPTRRPDGVFE